MLTVTLIIILLVSHLSISLCSYNIFIVLGCSNNFLQEDRISTVKNYINTLCITNTTKNIFYLSGGIKDLKQNSITEAELMRRQLEDIESDFILDIESTNTAENFMNFKKYVDNLDNDYEINIVTSEFHKKRAEKLFYGFFSYNIKPNWILGSASCMTCERDELIHMRNVQNDINKAKEK